MGQAIFVMDDTAEDTSFEQKRQALQEEKRELDRERRKLERERRELYSEIQSERRRMESERKLFEMKWQILEEETKKLADEKEYIERQRKFYEHVREHERRAEVPANIVKGEMFFVGVASEKMLKKRYRDLIKIYHPDNLEGDTGTIQEINKEYDRLRARYAQ